MLHGINSIFPTPEVLGHQVEVPILQKKLIQGDGLWETTKEILVWLFYWPNFTIQIMPDKCQKIAKRIKKVYKMKFFRLRKFQELVGNFNMHRLES